MKDYIGNVLAEGDRVVHGVGGRYGGLSGPYYVHSFTPKMVRLSRATGVGAQVSTTVPPTNLVRTNPVAAA
ncbi:hypothetical protein CYK37_29995 [Mesorhizobium loti]|nr:hypothetical protein [Mesorhizobium loti]PLP55524.1 hypothetical protein CYK37_29995 [Mesorhizobium loti]